MKGIHTRVYTCTHTHTHTHTHIYMNTEDREERGGRVEEEGMSEEYPRVNLEGNSHLEVQKRGKN